MYDREICESLLETANYYAEMYKSSYPAIDIITEKIKQSGFAIKKYGNKYVLV